MLNILNSYIINIKKSLEFLINRGNVEIHELDINSLEYSDTVDYYDSIYHKQGNHNYVVFLNSKYYAIDCTTDKDTALIILNDINNITYFYDEDKHYDSVLGDTYDIMKQYGYVEYDYINFICSLTYVPSKEERFRFLERINRQ